MMVCSKNHGANTKTSYDHFLFLQLRMKMEWRYEAERRNE